MPTPLSKISEQKRGKIPGRDAIFIKGAKVHNLKNVDVTIPRNQLIVVTGLSGSGKGSVLRTFEDLGFYCVDNMPVDLIPNFAELYSQSEEIQRAALLVV